MDKTAKRNIWGSIAAFLLGVVLGGVGISIMMFREAYQSNKYGFPIEVDDIIRYSAIGAFGYAIQIAILLWILL